MDVNIEIAARAAEYLVLAHDWVLTNTSRSKPMPFGARFEVLTHDQVLVPPPTDSQLQRAHELLPALHATQASHDCWQRFIAHTTQLLAALAYEGTLPPCLAKLLDKTEGQPATAWRQTLRARLYDDPLLANNEGKPSLRRRVCEALEFVPVLVLGLRQQLAVTHDHSPPTVAALLDNPELLADELDGSQAAVPFPHMLGRELEEICLRRRQAPPRPFGRGPGPLGLAEELRLSGLSLSGGGIRSATFSLGVVQALATRGWLPHLDYLSTVSGGGYLGAWLTSWIKRAGSLDEVQRNLDPVLTPNPRGEETRPIRWLRSYSNFLAPKASALSTDIWTVGITWLRNALVNQLILVLGLAAVLLFVQGLVPPWVHLKDRLETHNLPGWLPVLGLGTTALLVLGAATGVGWVQSWFRERRARRQELQEWLRAGAAPDKRPPARPPLVPITHWPAGLLVSLFGAALALTVYAYYHVPRKLDSAFWVYVWLGQALVLLGIAGVGRYDLCFTRRHARLWHVLRVGITLAATAAVTAGAGTVLLRLLWRMLWQLGHGGYWVLLSSTVYARHDPSLEAAHALVLGPPALVSVVAVVATLRMALLGRDFPDERREWWGRLGALAQLAVVAWLGLLGIAVLGPAFVDKISSHVNWPATTTAWLAFVGTGVKLAQSVGTSAQDQQSGPTKTVWWREWVARLTPYVFIVGLLLLLACGTRALVEVVNHTALPYLKLHKFPWPSLHPHWVPVLLVGPLLGGLSLALSARVGVNEFSMHHFYKNRLLRAYLGASRPRQTRTGNPFSGFDIEDDLKLCRLQHHDPTEATRRPAAAGPLSGQAPPLSEPGQPYDGPLLIINTALNVTRGSELAHQDRKAESFVFTPRYSGFDFARMVPVQSANHDRLEYAYRPTRHYAYPNDNGPGLGTVMAISGAAANPNMGYHSSPATAFLLTLFNVRLGWWMGNPRREKYWLRSDPGLGLGYLLSDLFGRARSDNRYVNLSDGGHFDNLGLYELVRRRCRYVLVCDAEEDADFRFEALANAIRRCRVDFGVEIELDTTPLHRDDQKRSSTHVVLGRICYPHLHKDEAGYLIYLKSTLTGQEPPDVLEYAHEHAAFPHQTTGDQFFSEPQFESYRRLGYHAALQALPPATGGRTPRHALMWWPTGGTGRPKLPSHSLGQPVGYRNGPLNGFGGRLLHAIRQKK